MLHDSASEADPDDCDNEPEFVEVDPSGRYGRVRKVLQFFLYDFIFLVDCLFVFLLYMICLDRKVTVSKF